MECKICVTAGPVEYAPGVTITGIIGWRCDSHGYYQPGNQPLTDPPGVQCPIGMIEDATEKALARINGALSSTGKET